ncbi:hypothetical protein P3X46_013655 [Hevea brasiliensis]|uniref:Inositol-tetrakisphosphate 1-kinase n=3 Tax=Hevea brasiliensis TaxID=3981 RepID=A0ABQ9M839_HEVBR|nr:hypothetical protein P3X46_013655 [Hevea brasiliensis]KAJ9175073.1 hypothetical protein P3X46_013655 [Hevea brasiliensis]
MRINGEITPQEEEEKGEAKTVRLSIQQPRKLVVVGYALTSKKKKSFLQPKLEVLARVFWAMRINGEITPQEEEEKGEAKTVRLSIQQPRKLVVVGYALTSKKKKSFLQPKLEVLARNKGILFVAIDLNRPLSDQGPFDVILHKLSGKDWCEVIEDYQQKHLEAIVLDPPDAIQHLHNRQSMLQDVADLDLSDCQGKVCVPRQMVVNKDPSSIPREVTKAGLKLPLVAKPLVVDGTAKSHELFLAYDEFSLSELEPPLVLQEFVNHGGVLFKIYVVGEAIKVVRRFSLPNISKCELAKVAGVFRFPRVSSAASSADDVDLDPSVGELPPRPLLERLARELRHRLGLRLFNIDMIREHGTQDVFYVIDINYFPGYGKMPDYEHTFTDFLLGLVQSKYKKRPAK